MFKTIPGMLANTIEKYPDHIALKIKKGESYQTFTYRELGIQVQLVTNGLAKLGLKANDKIAILSNNRPEWPISDFAIFCLQGITVPIYQTLPPNQIEYILKDSETRAIFVENQEQFDKIQQIDTALPNLEFIITFEMVESDIREVVYYNELLNLGKEYQKDHPDFFKQSMDTIDPESTCSLVYTSGTTGNPKGVMLNHRGFIHDIVYSEAQLKLRSTDTFLSFLPLSHLYERLAGHWCPMYVGATIHYAQSVNTVIDDLQDARPNVIVSVPRVFEKIAAKVQDQVESSSKIKQWIFSWAQKTGLKYHSKKIDNQLNWFIKKRYKIADKLVFRKIKKVMGGNMRYPIAGGAPLSVETLKFFEALDMQIIEGYGMTETHLIITLTPFGHSRYGSCGKPIKGVEVKIADDGEVLVKGPTVMAGYYNKPAITRETIDEEGWLHTGDIGHLDKDNYLYLTDRKKNILVTSGGKNVPAAPIENILKKSKYIEDICLVGNFRKFISALIIPNFESLRLWAESRDLKAKTDAELVALPEVIELYSQTIEQLQNNLARFEKVKKFILLPDELTVENGELTPSLKIKRSVIEKKYKKEIDALYDDINTNPS
ncbi:MAG: long-chain fatty acid--CoA ligase [Candidatus Marinimicrobia bacterium]|nr:long-chain fatty acid--CoA ligase [Candidatus Neomarinimicrobiota bacterium]RKY61283.1 MAG: long-chain fatty acid--CoA ligase [Candidatus Neomarinimicrobiota bacterium]